GIRDDLVTGFQTCALPIFPDELGRDEALRVVDQLMASQVPYLSFSGGEPMLHPHFFEMVGRVTSRGAQLKIETNGHYLDPENCRSEERRVGQEEGQCGEMA